jgi:hypothetical protein
VVKKLVGDYFQLYRDHFDLTEKQRRCLMRGYEVDDSGRFIVGINPGDKFIVKMNDFCSYLVLTTTETFEVFPGQEFFGVCLIEEGPQGFRPYEILMYGSAILLQDDDDEPWAVYDKDGAWIDYPSTFNNFDVMTRLQETAGYKYLYEVKNVDNHKLGKVRWSKNKDGEICCECGIGRTKYLGAKPITLNKFLSDIRKKLHREFRYDEKEKCICF